MQFEKLIMLQKIYIVNVIVKVLSCIFFFAGNYSHFRPGVRFSARKNTFFNPSHTAGGEKKNVKMVFTVTM